MFYLKPDFWEATRVILLKEKYDKVIVNSQCIPKDNSPHASHITPEQFTQVPELSEHVTTESIEQPTPGTKSPDKGLLGMTLESRP